MGFLRTMYGIGMAKDDPRNFLVEAMVAAIDADGVVSETELDALHRKLDTHELFTALTQETKERLIDNAADAIERAGGGRARMAAIASGLPSRAERVMAYSLACEMCVADNDLAEKEITFLEGLQEAFGLPDEEAKGKYDATANSAQKLPARQG